MSVAWGCALGAVVRLPPSQNRLSEKGGGGLTHTKIHELYFQAQTRSPIYHSGPVVKLSRVKVSRFFLGPSLSSYIE
jgi:hypothetical protein